MEALGTPSSVLESQEEPWSPPEGEAVGMGDGATFLWDWDMTKFSGDGDTGLR